MDEKKFTISSEPSEQFVADSPTTPARPLAPRLKIGDLATKYEMRPNPTAIFHLAIGTSAGIASALVLPDAFSLLPSAPSVLAYFVRLAGLWMYAYLFWATGFLAILHLVRVFGGGIKLDAEGLKLGKFSKAIAWESIEFVCIDERRNFAKVFGIQARELKMHIRKSDGKLTVKSLPSFVFTQDQFFSLFFYICQIVGGVQVSSFDVMVFKDPNSKELKKQAEQGRVKKVIMTVVISLSLISFLGRKSAVNYYYNMGNVQFSVMNLKKAAEYYGTATKIDWTFAPAWDKLARSEFRSGDVNSAREHWKKALQVKPDLVEAKLGLSGIYILEGDLEAARALIQKANRLAEFDEAGFLNRALIESLTGNNRTAIAMLEPFIRQKVGKDQAVCLLARCYIKEGEIDAARQLLSTVESKNLINPFLLSVAYAELELADGNTGAAANALRRVDLVKSRNPELLNVLAQVAILQGDLPHASVYIQDACDINKTSPWIALTKAKLAAAKGDEAGCHRYMDYCLKWRYEDPCLLSACAKFCLTRGENDQAATLAKRALQREPGNKFAITVLQSVQNADKSNGSKVKSHAKK